MMPKRRRRKDDEEELSSSDIAYGVGCGILMAVGLILLFGIFFVLLGLYIVKRLAEE